MAVEVLIRRLLVVVTVLVLGGFLTWCLSYRRMGETRDQVTHTREVIGRIADLERTLQDLELQLVGVLLPGAAARRPAIDAARVAIPDQIARLRELTRDNPDQQRRLVELEPRVTGVLAAIPTAIAEPLPADPAWLAAREVEVKAARELLVELSTEESRLLEIRRAEALGATRWMSLIGAISLAILIVIVIAMYPLIRRQLAAQREANARLARSERFLDEVVENIPNMVFVKEARELRFERFNRAGERLLGEDRANLLGKNDFDFFPKDQAEFFQAKDRETLAAGEIVDIPEEPIETKAGKRWLHTRKVPIRDPDGTPRYLLGISEDITEQREHTEALRVARDHAETASGELEAFSYSVAHDLRAPLRAIDGFTQAVVDDHGGQLPPEGRELLGRVRAASQRMAGIIDSLLALARLARADLVRARIDLSAKVRSITDELARANPDRTVEVVIEPGLIATGDAAMLRRALENLLANAWKFTAKRGADARVEFGRRVGDEPAFFVRDNGAGFDMAHKDKLFAPFQRLHAASEFDGSGVGLATVARVIERHGGRAWAEGEVGRGATFWFVLPEESK